MSVTKFKKGDEPYILIVALTEDRFQILRNVVKHVDVTDMEYFPTLSVFCSDRRWPAVFNWNEIRFYWEADSQEAEDLELEIDAAKTRWEDAVDDENPH